MVITANSGPFLGFGITVTSSGAVQQYNEDRGPSVFDLGSGLMDPRQFYRYEPGSAVNPNSSAVVGAGQWQTFHLWDNVSFIDYIPNTANSSAIAVAQTAVSGANLTLTAAGSSVGAISTTITAPESGQAVSVIAIDSTAAFVDFGQSGVMAAWNPRAGTGRTILITTSSSGDGGTATVVGRDMYGFKMTEQIALSTATNTAASSNAAGYKWPGQKAFKYVSAVSASTTVTSSWSVGFRDVFGFPGAVNYCGLNSIVNVSTSPFNYNSTAAPLSSATVILASTAATQTSTTPDVRGTYAPTIASNGTTVRLQMFVGYDPVIMSQITPTDASAIFGAAQFSSV